MSDSEETPLLSLTRPSIEDGLHALDMDSEGFSVETLSPRTLRKEEERYAYGLLVVIEGIRRLGQIGNINIWDEVSGEEGLEMAQKWMSNVVKKEWAAYLVEYRTDVEIESVLWTTFPYMGKEVRLVDVMPPVLLSSRTVQASLDRRWRRVWGVWAISILGDIFLFVLLALDLKIAVYVLSILSLTPPAIVAILQLIPPRLYILRPVSMALVIIRIQNNILPHRVHLHISNALARLSAIVFLFPVILASATLFSISMQDTVLADITYFIPPTETRSFFLLFAVIILGFVFLLILILPATPQPQLQHVRERFVKYTILYSDCPFPAPFTLLGLVSSRLSPKSRQSLWNWSVHPVAAGITYLLRALSIPFKH